MKSGYAVRLWKTGASADGITMPGTEVLKSMLSETSLHLLVAELTGMRA